MNNKQAIRKIRDFGLYHAINDLPYSILTVEAFKMAITALENEPVHCIAVNVNIIKVFMV